MRADMRSVLLLPMATSAPATTNFLSTHDLYDDDDADLCACACCPSTSGLYAWCDAVTGGDDDDVIKIASVNGSADGAVRRVSGHDDACVDRVPLCDWTGRVPASAPLLPADMVVSLATCRIAGYQTTMTTTTSSALIPPPSYADSVCRCIHQPPPTTLRPTYYHRHYPDSSDAELLTSRAAQLNFYTNRT